MSDQTKQKTAEAQMRDGGRTVAINPAGRDPLLRLIISSPKAIWFSAGIALLIALLPFPAAYFEGTLFQNPSLQMSLIHDLGYWSCMIIGSPLLIIGVGFYLRSLPTRLEELRESKIILVDDVKWENFKTDIAQKLYSRSWILVLTVIVIAVGVGIGWNWFIYSAQNTWHSTGCIAAEHDLGLSTITEKCQMHSIQVHWAGWLNIPAAVLWFYMLAVGVLRVVVSYFVLKEFFNLGTNVQPLHPDGCGGLYPLGGLSMKLNIVVFAVGIFTIVSLINNKNFLALSNPDIADSLMVTHPVNLLIIACYVVGAAVVYFLPLYAAHGSMYWAKYKTVKQINDRYEAIRENTKSVLSQGNDDNGAKLNEMVNTIENLRKLHAVASSMPVYPFNLRIITSFLASIGPPIIILIFEHNISKYILSG